MTSHHLWWCKNVDVWGRCGQGFCPRIPNGRNSLLLHRDKNRWKRAGTYCLMHSGMPTYSMGTSSASSAKLKTYLIFWLNFELGKKTQPIISIFLTHKTDISIQGTFFWRVFENYLINGLVTARRVRINHEGWTMIRDFRFFRNLEIKKKIIEISINYNTKS